MQQTVQSSPALQPLRGMAPSHGPEAEALLDEVRASLAAFAGLLAHEKDVGRSTTDAIRRVLEEVEGRLSRRDLRVAVVGEPGSGNGPFLDALLGERLLGMTAPRPRVVVTVRRASERAYRARFANGAVEAFATRVPDRTPKLAEELASLESACASAARRCDEAATELAAAAYTLEGAEHRLADTLRALEIAGNEAERLRSGLERVERIQAALLADVTRRRAALPRVVQTTPSWWALWSWVARTVLLLFIWRAFRAYRELARECEDGEAGLLLRRSEASNARNQAAGAEAALASANAPVEQARKAVTATRRICKGAVARREELEREAERRRSKLEGAREERQRQFAAEVGALVDAQVRGADLVELDIEFPARFLPDEVIIIDVAGVTAETAEQRERAWRILRGQADGCILLAELERSASNKAQKLLEQLRKAVVHTVLLQTKLDDPQRFEADVAKVFALLRRERALIIGARSADMVCRCIGDAAAAEARAERSYQERIAFLEAQRIPDPRRFHAEQIEGANLSIGAAARRVVDAAKETVHDGTALVRVECAELIGTCKTKQELQALSPRLSDAIARGISLSRRAAQNQIDAQAEAALRGIEAGVFAALRERYHLLHEVASRPVSLYVDARLDEPGAPADLPARMEAEVRFGGLLSFARTLGALKHASVAVTDACIESLERGLSEQIEASALEAAAAIRAGLVRSLEQAIVRFGRWIAEPLEAEREAILLERDRLQDLEDVRERLARHGAQLASLVEAATGASVGLCS